MQNRRVLGAGVLALGAALVLAGCGAGQITQTDSQQPAVNGTYAQVKTIVLRNAAVQYPTSGPGYPVGATPALTLTIVNQGAQDDSLVSVTTEDGTQATIGGSKDVVAAHSLVVGPDDAVESTNEAQTSAPASPSSSASSTPTAAGSSSATASPGNLTATATAEVPSSGPAATPTAPEKVGQATVTLPALKQPLWPGQVIKVTFVFKNAGPVTVELPVAAPAHAKE
nr:copper chaperone PCu(A)C [Amycolatopsis sp. SID8362]